MAEQKKRIVVNAFEMTCIGHQSFDLWRHPRSRATGVQHHQVLD